MTPVLLLVAVVLGSCGGDSPPDDPTRLSQRPTDDAVQTPTGLLTPSPSADPARTPVLADSPPVATRGFSLIITTPATHACETSPDEDGLLPWATMIAASECVAGYFVWPQHRQLDFDWVLNRDPANRPDAVQAGFQYTIAEGANWCAWYGTWLEARAAGDQAAADAALDVLLNVLPNYPQTVPGFPDDLLHPSVLAGMKHEAQRAQLGDPAPIQRAYDVNCTAIQWQETP